MERKHSGRLELRRRRMAVRIKLLVVFAVLITLGFPGNLSEIIGESAAKMLEYASFAIEVLAMIASSGDTLLDIRLVGLRKRYAPLYAMVGVFFIESMFVTRYPAEQVITCVRLTGTMLFAIWLQEQYDFEEMLRLFCTAQAIFILLNVLFIALYPARAYESGDTYFHALRGLYATKNTLAGELTVGIINTAMLLWVGAQRQAAERKWMVLLLAQLIMIFLCQATSAQLCLVLVLAPLFMRKDRRIPWGWVSVIVSTVFLVACLNIMPRIAWVFEAMGKDATLTGRIPLWRQIIKVMTRHQTFTGFGYSMFWRDPNAVALVHAGFSANSFMGQMTSGAHNLILEFWLNSGVIGLAMLMLAVVMSFRYVKAMPVERYLYCGMLAIYITTNGLTERCLGGNYDYRTISFFLALAIGCNTEKPTDIQWRRKDPFRAQRLSEKQ